MESAFPHGRLAKRSHLHLLLNGWRITRGTQPERRVSCLSLIATTSRILALSLLLLSGLMNIRISLFTSNPCLTLLNSAYTSFTPNHVYPLVHISHWAISCRFRNHQPYCPKGAPVSSLSIKYLYGAKFLSEPHHYAFANDFMYPSSFYLAKVMMYPITQWWPPMIRSAYTDGRHHLATFEFEKMIASIPMSLQ
jgi:hypothetical protein